MSIYFIIAKNLQNLCDAENEGEMEDVKLDERSVTSIVDDLSSSGVVKEVNGDSIDKHNQGKVTNAQNEEDDKFLKEEQAKQVSSLILHLIQELYFSLFTLLNEWLNFF